MKTTHTERALIRAHLSHGRGNRRVVIHIDGRVSYYGALDHTDRDHDYWHCGGDVAWLLIQIAAQEPEHCE